MRLAYVAAGAVMFGATVTDTRSVTSNPKTMRKVSKRQSPQANVSLNLAGSMGVGVPSPAKDQVALPVETSPDGRARTLDVGGIPDAAFQQPQEMIDSSPAPPTVKDGIPFDAAPKSPSDVSETAGGAIHEATLKPQEISGSISAPAPPQNGLPSDAIPPPPNAALETASSTLPKGIPKLRELSESSADPSTVTDRVPFYVASSPSAAPQTIWLEGNKAAGTGSAVASPVYSPAFEVVEPVAAHSTSSVPQAALSLQPTTPGLRAAIGCSGTEGACENDASSSKQSISSTGSPYRHTPSPPRTPKKPHAKAGGSYSTSAPTRQNVRDETHDSKHAGTRSQSVAEDPRESDAKNDSKMAHPSAPSNVKKGKHLKHSGKDATEGAGPRGDREKATSTDDMNTAPTSCEDPKSELLETSLSTPAIRVAKTNQPENSGSRGGFDDSTGVGAASFFRANQQNMTTEHGDRPFNDSVSPTAVVDGTVGQTAWGPPEPTVFDDSSPIISADLNASANAAQVFT